MRSLQESRPKRLTDTFPSEEEVKQKFDQIITSSFSPEERLLFSLLTSQNPLQAVVVEAVDTINKIEASGNYDTKGNVIDTDMDALEAEIKESVDEESAIQEELHFAKWETELRETYDSTPTNRQLAELGGVLDYSRNMVTNKETAELWLFLKQKVADIKTLPDGESKSVLKEILQSDIARFIKAQR